MDSPGLPQRRVLEREVRRDDDAAEVSGVPPNLTEGVRRGGTTGTDARSVLVIDVEAGRTVELVVKGVQGISAQSQRQALVELEVLLDAQVHLVTGLGASDVTADGAGKGVASAEIVDRKSVVDDEMNVGRIDRRARWRSQRCIAGTLATAYVDQEDLTSCGVLDVSASGVERSISITENRTAGVESATDEVIVEEAVTIRVAIVGVLNRSYGDAGLIAMRATELPATQSVTEETLLRALPRHFIENVSGENVGIGLRRNAALPSVEAEWIDGDRSGNAARTGEDFAGVVQGLAKGIGEIPSQSVKRPELEFVLEAVIEGPGPVVAGANQCEVAICAPEGIG